MVAFPFEKKTTFLKMYSLLNKIRFILAFVFFIFMIQSSTSSPQYPPPYFFTAPTILTSSPLENNNQAQLFEQLDRTFNLMGGTKTKRRWWFLVAENARLNGRLNEVQMKIDDNNAQTIARLNTLQNKMDAENAQLNERLVKLQTKTDADNAQLIDRLVKLQTKTDADNAQLIDRLGKLQTKTDADNAQTIARFNSVEAKMTADNAQLTARLNAMQAKTDAENVKLTGKLNNLEAEIAKLKNRTKVHFYVQRTSNFGTVGSVIPFEVAELNEGGAFDLPTGIFKAPVPGIYHFDFSALKEYTDPVDQVNMTIRLQVNGANVGSAHNDEKQTVHSVVSLNASLRLKAGDTVNLYLTEGEINDISSHRTHFSGWLVDEDLM